MQNFNSICERSEHHSKSIIYKPRWDNSNFSLLTKNEVCVNFRGLRTFPPFPPFFGVEIRRSYPNDDLKKVKKKRVRSFENGASATLYELYPRDNNFTGGENSSTWKLMHSWARTSPNFVCRLLCLRLNANSGKRWPFGLKLLGDFCRFTWPFQFGQGTVSQTLRGFSATKASKLL